MVFAKFGGVEQIITDAQTGLSNSSNLTLTQIEATPSGTKTTLRAALTFKDAREVGDLLKNFRDPSTPNQKSDEEILVGETNLDVGIPHLSFSRKLDAREFLPTEARNPMALRLLGESQITYKIHLPTPAKTHNADQIFNDRKSLQWNVPLSRLLAEPVEMKFTAPLPRLPLYLTLAALLILLFTLGFVFWRRAKNSASTSTNERN